METSLAQPEAWLALLMILVSVTSCKISSKGPWLIIRVRKKKKKKANDACLERTKINPGMRPCYIHVACITKQM